MKPIEDNSMSYEDQQAMFDAQRLAFKQAVTVGPLPTSANSALSPAKFYYRQVLSAAKSIDAGRPIYEDVLYIKITHDPLSIADRPATEHDKRLYGAEYAKFEYTTKQTTDGTSIDVLFSAASTHAINLRAQGIFTCEQLVDANLGEYSARARRYFESLEKNDKFRTYETLLESKDIEITNLKKYIESLRNKIEALENDIALAGRMRGGIM